MNVPETVASLFFLIDPVLELLQLPAKDGGDQLVMNGNYIPITMVGEQYKSSPEGGENSGGN